MHTEGNGWTVRQATFSDRAAVGRVLAAAFADIYGPALGGDRELAAAIAAIQPTGLFCYVGERDGIIRGAGLLAYAGQGGYEWEQERAVWQALRTRQSLVRAIQSRVLLSFAGSGSIPDRLTGYISSLAVDPTAQGQGLGTALLAHMEGVARMAGKTRLALHVTNINEDARRLYEREGFRVVRTEPTLFTRRLWGYSALLYMVKRLM